MVLMESEKKKVISFKVFILYLLLKKILHLKIMKNRFPLLLALIFFISLQSFSQDFKVPANYKLEAAEDYAKYEQDVIDAVTWLQNTPVNEERGRRKEVVRFLMQWITGSPTVTIEIGKLVTFMDDADYLMLFMGGWTKYALTTKDFTDKVKGNQAGIESVIDFYKKNKDIMGTHKGVEKYIKLQEKGKLAKYIESKV